MNGPQALHSFKSAMEAERRTTSQKRLAPNQRVSGAVGDFIPGPSKRRRRQRLFGHVLRAMGEKCYLVRFDDGQEKECSSNILKVESSSASLPPDMPLPVREVTRDMSAVEEAAGDPDVLDGEEVEDMPAIRPEEEDAEAADEEGNPFETDVPNNDAEDDVAMPNRNAENEIHDPNGRMPGQLPTEASSVVKDYHSIKRAAKEKIAALVGTEVTVTSRKNGCLRWTVVDCHSPPVDELRSKASSSYGLKDFFIGNYRKSEVLAHIFLELMFQDWTRMVHAMNLAVDASKAKCKKFTSEEFLTGLGLIIGSAEFSQIGVDLFGTKKDFDSDDENLNEWPSICPSPQFEQFMAFSRFKDFRRFLPSIFADESRKESDPWWAFSSAVEQFNLIRSTKVNCSPWICVDETMCAWRPRTTA